jgi:broad specificity phosphatase PhoE
LLLVRHGQASFGAADYDVLSVTGLQQAKAVSSELSARGVRVDRVISGSMGRQHATAKPIAAAAGLQVEIDSRWDEYDTDDILEHHSLSPIRQNRPKEGTKVTAGEFQAVAEAAVTAWLAAGVDDMCREPWHGFATRVRAALEGLGNELQSGETALVCTSGGVVAALCVWLLAVPEPTFVRLNRVTVNAGITRVAYGSSGATLISFNEQGHLLADDSVLLTYR